MQDALSLNPFCSHWILDQWYSSHWGLYSLICVSMPTPSCPYRLRPWYVLGQCDVFQDVDTERGCITSPCVAKCLTTMVFLWFFTSKMLPWDLSMTLFSGWATNLTVYMMHSSQYINLLLWHSLLCIKMHGSVYWFYYLT